jgi:hypothetical protein
MNLYALLTAGFVAFAAVAYFTRATARRIAGGWVGGVAAAAWGYTGDRIASHFGYWSYVNSDPSHAPWLAYGAVAFGTAALALVGWRIDRLARWEGLAFFIVAAGIESAVMDVLVGLQKLAPGVLPWVVSIATWISVNAVAFLAMRLVAGPSDDPLRPSVHLDRAGSVSASASLPR